MEKMNLERLLPLPFDLPTVAVSLDQTVFVFFLLANCIDFGSVVAVFEAPILIVPPPCSWLRSPGNNLNSLTPPPGYSSWCSPFMAFSLHATFTASSAAAVSRHASVLVYHCCCYASCGDAYLYI